MSKIEWTPVMDALLGTIPDQEAAEKLGFSKTAVRVRRIALGIPLKMSPQSVHYGTNKIVWTPAMDALLGTMPDSDTGWKLGLSTSAVRVRRIALGIPLMSAPPSVRSCATKFEWTPAMDALLGTMPDRETSEKLGLSASAVRVRRIALGIPLKLSTHSVCKFIWTPAIESQLGIMGDRQLADKLGVSSTTVAKHRRLLGIAPGVDPVGINVKFDWPPELVALLGTKPDNVIAKQLGLSTTTVRKQRILLNIATSRVIQWSQDQIALLGTAPDSKLAVLWGLSSSAVTVHRNKMNIPAYEPPSLWTPQMDALLGAMPDKELAKQLGLSYATTYRRRKALGIPSKRGKR